MGETQNVQTNSILIKRYGGCRLYDTIDLTYVSLDDLAEMVLRRQRFVVRDCETGDDITREILDRLH